MRKLIFLNDEKTMNLKLMSSLIANNRTYFDYILLFSDAQRPQFM